MKRTIIFCIISAALISCGDEEIPQEIVDDVSTKVLDDQSIERAERAQKVFQTIPSPYETALLFEESGIGYNVDALNPVENVNKYTTSVQQALNLGVYGADLSYANIHDQSQESMFYMNCSKKMADALGVAGAFTAEAIERIEENMNNRDSMMTIVSDAFWTCDSYLKENKQDNLSALIIAGGWLEGLYIGTRSINDDNPNQDMMQRIAEQKYSLNNLIDLLDSYDDDAVKNIADQLTILKSSFDKIEEQESETTVSKDDVPIIGGGSTLNYTPETIKEISATIESIRNEIIK
ncbi:MAG: hypothetical protein P1U41_05710 [Vicingaceae bacterium]|nr:hypothetical protein [Vicingaceae bacterium]